MAPLERASIPLAIVDEFRQIDCQSVGEVLVGMGLNCVAHGIRPLAGGMKACGPAVTVRHIATRDRRRWQDELLPVKLVDMAASGAVLVMDCGGRVDVGAWGVNVARQAQAKGLAGTIIDGACKDSEELIALQYPTFVRGVALQHPHGLFYSTCVNSEPVQIGAPPHAIMVAPGDLAIADT